MTIDTFFTSNESAMQYECNFSCDNAIFFKNNAESYFITDSRYTLEAKSATSHIKNINIVESSDLVKDFIKIAKKAKEITFDPLNLNVESYNKIKDELSLKAEPNFHQKKRILKTKQEIELIAKSQELNKKAFKKFAKYLNKMALEKQPLDKLDELFLHFKARRFLEYSGKYSISFNPILALNANAAKPHALPTKEILKKDDLVLFDAGIKYKGYCSDMTRIGFFGETFNFDKSQRFPKKIQKIYDIVLKAQENAIKNIRVGMSAKEVDNLTRNVIQKAGYGKFFTHSTGHGVGLDIHELPRISPNSETIIEDNMVFSIEPGIYLPNEFGIRIEDLVVIQNGRAKVI
ncbi:MAG: M24 family metallopeptidase [Helicobacteraceae bacterium]|nr:M24 family metallopeptidase [Helicobacteraceae bacterium]